MHNVGRDAVGPLFVIVIWLFIAILGAIVWAPFLGWFIIARIRKRRGQAILASIPAFGMPLLALSLIATVVVFTASGFVPRVAFAREFGFSLPADISELRGSRFGPFDEVTTYLDFRASQNTIERIARHLAPCDTRRSCGDPAVVWEPGSSLHCYQSSDLGRIVLIWDPASQIACYDSWRLQ